MLYTFSEYLYNARHWLSLGNTRMRVSVVPAFEEHTGPLMGKLSLSHYWKFSLYSFRRMAAASDSMNGLNRNVGLACYLEVWGPRFCCQLNNFIKDPSPLVLWLYHLQFACSASPCGYCNSEHHELLSDFSSCFIGWNCSTRSALSKSLNERKWNCHDWFTQIVIDYLGLCTWPHE